MCTVKNSSAAWVCVYYLGLISVRSFGLGMQSGQFITQERFKSCRLWKKLKNLRYSLLFLLYCIMYKCEPSVLSIIINMERVFHVQLSGYFLFNSWAVFCCSKLRTTWTITLSRNINAFLILFLMNVFQSLDRQSFVETFVVMLVVEKGHLNEVSTKRVVALIVPVVCRRKLKKFHLSIHITTTDFLSSWHQLQVNVRH